YIHTPQTAREESQTASTAAQTGKEVTNRQDIDLAIKQLDIVGATIGYVNQAAATPYRAFFTDTELHRTNLTNKSDPPEPRAEMRGRFMGSGPTRMSMAFRPHQKGGSLNLKVSIEDTDMVKMNDLLRSHAKIEVAGGDFSLYSEVSVKDGAINGYVKPLFKNIT